MRRRCNLSDTLYQLLKIWHYLATPHLLITKQSQTDDVNQNYENINQSPKTNDMVIARLLSVQNQSRGDEVDLDNNRN